MLTLLSAHWFAVLSQTIPGLQTHFLSLDLPTAVPQKLHVQLHGRSMQVRKLKIFPIEAIVRGYITGSAWKEYQLQGTVHGMEMPRGLQEAEAFPGGAIYTPSTKAEQGEHGTSNAVSDESGDMLKSVQMRTSTQSKPRDYWEQNTQKE